MYNKHHFSYFLNSYILHENIHRMDIKKYITILIYFIALFFK